jgi:hypothetical protein
VNLNPTLASHANRGLGRIFVNAIEEKYRKKGPLVKEKEVLKRCWL